jgi:hypothetical protein
MGKYVWSLLVMLVFLPLVLFSYTKEDVTRGYG